MGHHQGSHIAFTGMRMCPVHITVCDHRDHKRPPTVALSLEHGTVVMMVPGDSPMMPTTTPFPLEHVTWSVTITTCVIVMDGTGYILTW